MANRRADLFYLAVIALAAGAAWLGTQFFGGGSERSLDERELAGLVREIELPPIDLSELSFGFFRPSARYAPLPARIRSTDEVEVALVRNRNLLLTTSVPVQ